MNAPGADGLNAGSSTHEGRIVNLAFPGESDEYRAARARLLEQEVELRRAMEDVAACRRALPPGGPIAENYVFQGAGDDGAPAQVRLSELFAPGQNSLVIYSFMFPRDPADKSHGPASGRCSTSFVATKTRFWHFWASELLYAATDGDQDPRHVGTIETLWNLFDLTPEGRPAGWYEQLSY